MSALKAFSFFTSTFLRFTNTCGSTGVVEGLISSNMVVMVVVTATVWDCWNLSFSSAGKLSPSYYHKRNGVKVSCSVSIFK